MARYMDILHVLNYWILGIFDFFVILPLELENMVRLLNFDSFVVLPLELDNMVRLLNF